MKKISILIAEDSIVYRSQIRAAMESLEFVEVIGTASNGRLAIARMTQNTPPDLLILDLEMPEMNGLETLKEMRRLGISTKVLMFSSASKRGAEVTLEALKLGANDFIAKPGADESTSETPTQKIKNLLLPKITALFPQNSSPEENAAPVTTIGKYSKVIWDIFSPEIVVIGSSTGGPSVLEKIFSDLSVRVECPIVITQHMPAVFTTTFAERLGKMSGIPSCEAKDGMYLEKNHIYLAPGNFHLRLSGDKKNTVISLDQGPQIHSVRPAVDPLFESAAHIFKERCLGLVLTGMGWDGKNGAIAIKNAGGAVIIQEKKSCAVFGMPGAVFNEGAYDRMATPDEIVNLLQDKVGIKIPRFSSGGA